MARRNWHRFVFFAAGVYNLVWGAYSAFDPQWLFRLTDMPPLNHPAIFACLGMVIGLYGVRCLDIARSPEGGGSSPRWGWREAVRADWLGNARLEWNVADRDVHPLPDERPDLVGSVQPLPV